MVLYQWLLRLLRSLFGAIEDWNSPLKPVRLFRVGLRSLFGAIEDWNSNPVTVFTPPSNCGRSSGRSRIGTHIGYRTHRRTFGIAVALRGDRGLELSLGVWARCVSHIAVALRGDRGLERSICLMTQTAPGLRSLFGAIEDWNSTNNNIGATQWNCGRSSGRSRIGTG